MSQENRGIVVFAATSVECRLFPDADGVVKVQTGMGAGRAVEAFRRALGGRIRGAVSFGFAAALMPDLRSGALLLPRAVRMPDGRRLAIDPLWHRQILAALGSAGHQPDLRDMVQVGCILDGAEAKSDMARRTSAAAADMESGALAEVAHANGLPLVVLRVVLDELADAVPATLSGAISPAGDVAPIRLLGGLLRQPAAVSPLLRLVLRRAVAGRILTSAARMAAVIAPSGTPPPTSV